MCKDQTCWLEGLLSAVTAMIQQQQVEGEDSSRGQESIVHFICGHQLCIFYFFFGSHSSFYTDTLILQNVYYLPPRVQ